jgi:hypothetical protein
MVTGREHAVNAIWNNRIIGIRRNIRVTAM